MSMSITFGQYLPLDSPIHQMDQRIRLLGFSIIFIAILWTESLWGMSLALMLLLGMIFLSWVPLSAFKKSVFVPLPFLLFLALLQLMFISKGPYWYEWGILKIGEQGLYSGVLLLFRFIALVILISLASYTTSTDQLMQGLEEFFYPLKKLGIPMDDLMLSFRITFQFVPFLFQTIERISKAQAARGADWDNKHASIVQKARQVLPIIVPLFIVTLRRAETLALALETRGYHSEVDRPRRFLQKPLTLQDWLVLLSFVIMAFAIIIL